MRWSFPSNNNGEINGIGHSGIETFQGSPLKSLAREICQNSLDASLNGMMTEIEFKTFQINNSDLPDVESLENAFIKSEEFWKDQKVRKTKDFLARGINTLTDETISFLRISDFNTTGLRGSRGEFNTPWCNLTKSSGASDKVGTAGGSFGIGKFAPFACSSLRTVFYNTLDDLGETAFQGISRIISFKDDSGEITTGVGFCGGENNTPVVRNISLDPSFSRETSGTDIYVSGFIYHKTNWKELIISSILDGFLYAVFDNKLKVIVEDVVIDKTTLPELLDDYAELVTENADKYYNVLTSPKTTWFEENFFNKGLIRLGLIIEEDYPRSVAMIRKSGMKIMDRKGISGIIPFAGVMLILGDDINDFLRQIENPQHTKWEPDRAVGHEALARTYKKALGDFIKAKLGELRGEEESDEIDPSIGEYLPDETNPSDNEKRKETISDKVKDVQVKKVQRAASFKEKAEGKEIGLDEGSDGSPSKGSGNKEKTETKGGNGAGEQQGEGYGSETAPSDLKFKAITPQSLRFVCLDKSEGRYAISFIPSAPTENGHLEIYLSAETQLYRAPLTHAKCLTHSGISLESNVIKGLKYQENKQIRLLITLNYHDLCSMEVKAYGLEA